MIYKKITILLFCFYLLISETDAQISGFQRTYGLPGFNYGVSAFETSDKGFMILGNKSGFTGNTDIYIINTDKNGYMKWDKALGGDSLMVATGFKQTPDKGMIISGYTNGLTTQAYDFLIIKTDSLANLEWENSFGGADWDFANSVAYIPNIAYFIAGKTYNNTSGMADAFVAAVSLNGDTLWTKTIGGSGDDVFNCIDTTNDGNLIASGYTNSFGNGAYDFYLVKIDIHGNILWTKTYGQTANEIAYAARATSDNGYVVIGSSNSYPAINTDPWLVKTNADGDSLWSYFYYNNNDEEFFDIKQQNNGKYLLAGYTTTWGFGKKEVIVHLVSSAGDYLYGNTYGGDWDDLAYSVGFASDGGFFFTGTTESKGVGLANIYFIKTNNQCYTDTNSIHIMNIDEIIDENILLNLYPNPTNNYINIDIKGNFIDMLYVNIYNMMGEIILTDEAKISLNKITLNYSVKNFKAGIYFLNIKNDKLNETLKFIITNK
jgi:hypothetical protein